MASTIRWRLMFRVADRAAFDKCLARVLPLLGSETVPSEARPYWKLPDLWECSLVMPVPVGSVAEQVLGCLLAAQQFASGWYIFGTLSPEGADGFSGVFAVGQGGASSHLAGLEWASFDLT